MKNNLLKAAAFGSVLAMTATASHAAGDQDKYQLSRACHQLSQMTQETK